MELVAKKPSGANLVHTFTLTTRLEGTLWIAIGFANGAALKFPALRPGALLVGALGTGLAGLTHMHHEGVFGEAPWHAVSHCVGIKSSTRLQCARMRPFRREAFCCASKTR